MKKEREPSKAWREEWRRYFRTAPPDASVRGYGSLSFAEMQDFAEHFFDAGVMRGLHNATKYLGTPKTAAQRAADTKRGKAAGK